MPLPIKIDDIIRQARELQRSVEKIRYPKGAQKRVLTVIDLLRYNRIYVMEASIPFRVSDDVYERLSDIMRNGRIPRIKCVVDKLRVIDVLEYEELDPNELNPRVYEVRLTPYGTLVFTELIGNGEPRDSWFLKPITENAEDLVLSLDASDTRVLVVKGIVKPIDTVNYGGRKIVSAALYVWVDGYDVIGKKHSGSTGVVEQSTPRRVEGDQQPRQQSLPLQQPEWMKQPRVEQHSVETSSSPMEVEVEERGESVEERVDASSSGNDNGEPIDTSTDNNLDSMFRELAELLLKYRETKDTSYMEKARVLTDKLLDMGVTKDEIKEKIRRLLSKYEG